VARMKGAQQRDFQFGVQNGMVDCRIVRNGYSCLTEEEGGDGRKENYTII